MVSYKSIIDMATTFSNFLANHIATDKSTHTSMTGGKWYIENKELGEFYKLYNKALDEKTYYLTEKQTIVKEFLEINMIALISLKI